MPKTRHAVSLMAAILPAAVWRWPQVVEAVAAEPAVSLNCS